jgi:predicted SnoaL-like aldol condensation-catalyzing enzyme
MVAMFSSGDVSAVQAVVHPDYFDHQGLGGEPVHGPSGFARVVAAARSSYARLEVTFQDVIADGDRAAARLQWHGTRLDGDVVRRETIEIIRTEQGRAVEHWGARC